MSRAFPGFCALALTAALLAGCAREQPRPPAPTVPPPYATPRAPPPSAGAISPAAYVEQASSIDLYEIRSSQLALQRSANKRIQEFASMMVQAHRGTSSQLSFAGRRLNLLPSARLLPRHQALVDALQSAPNFDAVYRQQQTAVHNEAVALHAGYAAHGTSPTLRPVAETILPIVQRHQRLLRYL